MGNSSPSSSPQENIDQFVSVYDNGGKTADRYTIVFLVKENGGYWYVGMSCSPFHPQGFCQHGFSVSRIDRPSWKHLGKRIKFEDLPEDCQKAVKIDLEQE